MLRCKIILCVETVCDTNDKPFSHLKNTKIIFVEVDVKLCYAKFISPLKQ